MEVRLLSRTDVGLLSAAVADHRKAFVSMVFAAIVEQHGLDLQVEPRGPDFALIATETSGDVVVAERRLPIVWHGLDETVRVFVLGVYVDGVLAGHRRWLRHVMMRLAGLEVVTVPAND